MPEVLWICTTREHPVGIVKVYDKREERWKYYIGTGNGRDLDEDVQLIIARGQKYYSLDFIAAFEEKKGVSEGNKPTAPDHKTIERDIEPYERSFCYGKLRKDIYSCPKCGYTLYVKYHQEKEFHDSHQVHQWQQGERTPHCPLCGQAILWE